MDNDAALTSTLLAFGFGLGIGPILTVLTMALGIYVGVEPLYSGLAIAIGGTIVLIWVYVLYRNPRPLFDLIEEVHGDA